MVLSWITATRSQQYAHCPPCRDIISRITLRWYRVIWEILRKPRPRASSFEILWSFRLQSFISIVPLFVAWPVKLDAAVGKALPPTAASPKEMGKHAHTRTASSPPSAAVNEWGCCCQVSCEFETAAERTHCALTTQSGTAAARLPGTTGSIWHSDDFTHTHTHTMKDCGPKSRTAFECSVKLKTYF